LARLVTLALDEDKPNMVNDKQNGAMLTLGQGLPLLTPVAMRAVEDAAIAAGIPALCLMERAAAAAVSAILRFAPGLPTLVLCGPGNNGGDGYAIACGLRALGLPVRVAAGGAATGEPAATMAARWRGPVEPLEAAEPAPLIIDALFGTGLSRPLPANIAAAIERLRGSGLVIAIDIASGIVGANGTALGSPLVADMTIAFGALKPGHVMGAGPDHSGRLVIAEIGVSTDADLHLVPPPQPKRLAPDTHKYRRGSVLVIEGDSTLGGAAPLTALAALRAGAGLVTLIGDGTSAPAEALMRRSDEQGIALLADRRTAAIAIGPGLSNDDRGHAWLERLLQGTTPLVIDAGALAILATRPDILSAARARIVLTPHDGEFTALFGAPEKDRIAATRAAATRTGAVVLLKGSATIIAAPDGRAAINSHGAPWAATAGSGDVLTGIIAALLAQGVPPYDAARAAAWLHGDAAIRGGPGLIADDIPAILPKVLESL
jgi:hydroxyethylthiazole kinase-like uncharacterized protein yjeF